MADFDPAKDAINIKKHGLSLAFGDQILKDPNLIETIDDRFNYGEERCGVIGMVAGIVYSAVYTIRDDGVRFISVRQSTKKEADSYYGQ